MFRAIFCFVLAIAVTARVEATSLCQDLLRLIGHPEDRPHQARATDSLNLEIRSGNWLAAQLRFQNVVEKYQTTSHAPEALYRLTETNLALGVPEEAKRYAAVLGANYPGNIWYQRAFELMQKKAPQQVAAAS